MPSLSRGARIERALHLLNSTMSYFSVDGLVSGIKSHMIEAASKPTDATLRNVAAQSKFAATNPKSAVLSAAPSPDAVSASSDAYSGYNTICDRTAQTLLAL